MHGKRQRARNFIQTGEDLIYIKVDKLMGIKYLFVSPPKGYFTLNKNGIEKLFSKR